MAVKIIAGNAELRGRAGTISTAYYDDSYATITCSNSYGYNGSTFNNLILHGNLYAGFGSNSMHLKVNQRDGAMHAYCYEELTMEDGSKCLWARWEGNTNYGSSKATQTFWELLITQEGHIQITMDGTLGTSNSNYSLATSNGTISFTWGVKKTVVFEQVSPGSYVKHDNCQLFFNSFPKKMLLQKGETIYTIPDFETMELLEVGSAPATLAMFDESGIEFQDFIISREANPELNDAFSILVPKQNLDAEDPLEFAQLAEYQTNKILDHILPIDISVPLERVYCNSAVCSVQNNMPNEIVSYDNESLSAHDYIKVVFSSDKINWKTYKNESLNTVNPLTDDTNNMTSLFEVESIPEHIWKSISEDKVYVQFVYNISDAELRRLTQTSSQAVLSLQVVYK